MDVEIKKQVGWITDMAVVDKLTVAEAKDRVINKVAARVIKSIDAVILQRFVAE